MALGEIKKIVRTVRTFSLKGEKNYTPDELQINDLLDTINDFKKELLEKNERLNEINQRIERLKNYKNTVLISDVISSAKDLYSSLICQYVIMNAIQKRGIARFEITCYKNSIIRLKGAYEELESLIPKPYMSHTGYR